MKKIAKVSCLLVCLVLLISVIPFNASAAPKGYEEYIFDWHEVTGGVYKDGLNGSFDNKYFECEIPEYVGIEMVDNDLEISFWSKPVKFADLKDQGGTWVPAIYCNLTRDGQPAKNVGGFKYWLRDLYDCWPLHFEIQLATNEAQTQWVTVFEGNDFIWEDVSMSFTFEPMDAYALRFVCFDIDEPSYLGEAGEYDNLVGDDTRLCCSEIEVWLYTGSGSPSTQPPTQKPTDPQPTDPKPTDPKPTDPAETDPAVTDPAETDPAEPTDPAETDPAETDPVETDPVETDPVETDPVETDPKETDPKETEPEATNTPTEAPSANKDAKEEPKKNNTGLIIGIVAAVVVVAGAAVLIIKKKK